jgi:hypothetical protein
MPAPLIPIAGAAIGAGARFVGRRAAQHVAQKFTAQGLQREAVKKAAVGVSGMGALNASPAQAPGINDRTTVSPESRTPEAPSSSIPDFGSTYAFGA